MRLKRQIWRIWHSGMLFANRDVELFWRRVTCARSRYSNRTVCCCSLCLSRMLQRFSPRTAVLLTAQLTYNTEILVFVRYAVNNVRFSSFCSACRNFILFSFRFSLAHENSSSRCRKTKTDIFRSRFSYWNIPGALLLTEATDVIMRLLLLLLLLQSVSRTTNAVMLRL